MGGKKALRNIIYRLFPKDFGRYIEVFGGGGWVLFGRPPDCKGMEVYNDFNGNLTNLFYCVKNRTLAFLKELGFLPSTPAMNLVSCAASLKRMNSIPNT